MRSFEQPQNLHHEQKPAFEKLLVERALDEYPSERPALDSFSHIPDSEKQEDKKRLAKKRNEPDREQEESFEESRLLEAVITKEGYRSEWLSGDVFTFPTTEFDDEINGSDLCIYWHDAKSPQGIVAISADVTVTSSAPIINDKLQETLERIEESNGSAIKYARYEMSTGEEKEGALKHLPKVVIGIPLDNFYRMLQAAKIKNFKPDSIAKHPFQVLMLEQILNQLETLLIIASRRLHSPEVKNLFQGDAQTLKFLSQIQRLTQKEEITPQDTEAAIKEILEASRELNQADLYQRDPKGRLTLFLNTLKAYLKMRSVLAEREEKIPETDEKTKIHDSKTHQEIISAMPEVANRFYKYQQKRAAT